MACALSVLPSMHGEICAIIVININDGLPTLCKRLSLPAIPERAGAFDCSCGKAVPHHADDAGASPDDIYSARTAPISRLGGPTSKTTLCGRLQMEESVEPEQRKPMFAAASSVCPICKTHFRFSETLVDVRRDIFVRVFRCECGQVIWDEKRA
jgi:hypothetical protein